MKLQVRERSGFTILEVVLALGILLFGMVAVLGLLTTGAALTRTAQLRTEAATAVEAVLADLEETFFPPAANRAEGTDELGPPKPVIEKALPGSGGVVYSAVGRQDPNRPKEWRVDVELSWSSAGVRRERKFTTLLVQELPFGERLRRRFVDGSTPTEPHTAEPAPNAAEPAPR